MGAAPKLDGWPIVAWAALLIVVECAVTAGLSGVGEEGIRTGIRVTARSSLILFTFAFVASSFNALAGGPVGKWLLRNRRYIGVSFALSHLAHGVFTVALWLGHPMTFARLAEPITLIGGGIGYLFIAAMAATSFDRSTKWLGRRKWKALHKTGMYVFWGIFVSGYFGKALAEPVFWIPTVALFVAVGLRAAAWARLRRRQARSAAG